MKNVQEESAPSAKKRKTVHQLFDAFSTKATAATGSTATFILAVLFVIGWAVTGPFYHYSENWQFVINTSTSIVTFLMVFLIQKSQNKDSLAVQLKLNELVAAHEFASNRLVDVECMTEDELKVIRKYYARLSEMSKKEENIQQSHSIDEANERHQLKKELDIELEAIAAKTKNPHPFISNNRKKE